MQDWVQLLLSDADMLQMGHGQRAEDANLGLGWVYYSLVRALRPQSAVVIGSWRGFVPMVIAKALADNVEGGEVTFIEPSLVDDFWKDAAAVTRHFGKFGISNIRHRCLTTQAYVDTAEYAALQDLGFLFIDGMHTFAQAKFDYDAFANKLSDGALVLFHDSIRVRTSRIYGDDRAYEHRVKDFVDILRVDAGLELLDLPVDGGLTILRRRGRS